MNRAQARQDLDKRQWAHIELKHLAEEHRRHVAPRWV
jgi:hypothetical protein